jgi:hypothetical protein
MKHPRNFQAVDLEMTFPQGHFADKQTAPEFVSCWHKADKSTASESLRSWGVIADMAKAGRNVRF